MTQAPKEKPIADVISLGAGVQSTTMLLMAARGELGDVKPKYAVFADTGWEPQKVYEHLEWLTQEVAKYGVEVVLAGRGSAIHEDHLEKAAAGKYIESMPFHSLTPEGKKGLVMRQCTKHYKIVPVQQGIRKALGYAKGQRMKHHVRLWMGISTDEIQRVKPSRVPWMEHVFPLIDFEMSRKDCLAWLKANGYPLAPKSACIGCPFRNDVQWLDLKQNAPEDWESAVAFDKAMRNVKPVEWFLHRDRVPLDEVVLDPNKVALDDEDYFNNECEGMCGL